MNSYPVYPQLTDYNSVSTQCTLLTRGVPAGRRRHHVNLADLSYKDQLHWHFKQFCYKTSSHGIPMLGRAPNNFYRIVWLSLLCGCCAMFLYQSSNVVERYSRYDKITDIHLNFETAPFPAITICSLNPYLDSLLKDVEAIKKILNVYTTIILRAAKTNELVNDKGNEILTKAPAYSKCECVKSAYDENRLECTADKTSIPTSKKDEKSTEEVEDVGSKMKCLCAFDRGSGDAWPCYPHDKWNEQICGFCDKHSFCTLQPREGHSLANRSCLCQSLDPFCVGLSKDMEILKLWQYYGYFEKQIIETLGFQNMSDEVAIVTKAKENLIFAMSELSEKQRIALSIPKKQLIQKCSLMAKLVILKSLLPI
uniref:Uncharacterized protein n=1 Tax=Ditylenchus dipsaci TaxID=166011 RepID=A0A915ECM7_9BILA